MSERPHHALVDTGPEVWVVENNDRLRAYLEAHGAATQPGGLRAVMSKPRPADNTVSLHPETALRFARGEATELDRRVINAQLEALREEARIEARQRSRRSLDELWAMPGVLSAALDHLGLEAKPAAGQLIRLRCPACGKREAYLYRDAVAPKAFCNRRNNCPVGQSGGVLVFELLAERAGGKRQAIDALRGWAGEAEPVEWRSPRGWTGPAGPAQPRGGP